MKIYVYILALIELTCAKLQESELSDDVQDFLNLIPKDRYILLYYDYKDDPDVVQFINYINSEDFTNTIIETLQLQQTEELFDFLEYNGVSICSLIKQMKKMFGFIYWPTYPHLNSIEIYDNMEKTDTLKSEKIQEFINDFVEIFPWKQLVSLIFNKFATSKSIQNLYNIINNMDHQKLYNNALISSNIIASIDKLKKLGLNTRKLGNAAKVVFGWDLFENRNADTSICNEQLSLLGCDLFDFINLIPKEKYILLLGNYSTHPIFHKAIDSIDNYKYYNILKIFIENLQWLKFFAFLDDNNVYFYNIKENVKDKLGITYWFHNTANFIFEVKSSSNSIIDLLDFAKQIAPVEEIKGLAMLKLSNSKAYQKFHNKLHNLVNDKEFQEQLFHNPEYIRISVAAASYGFDVLKISQFIFSLFGIDYKVNDYDNTITYELFNLLKFIPKEKYIDLYHKYKNDQNIWKLFKYLKSSEFKDIVNTIESYPELNNFKTYLTNVHFPFNAFVIEFFNQLGIYDWLQNYDLYCLYNYEYDYPFDPNSSNLKNFIKEIIELFPIKDILVDLSSKFRRPAVNNFYEHIKRLNGTKIRNLLNYPHIKQLVLYLNIIGFNTHDLWKDIKTFFKWEDKTIPYTNLKTDINDFKKIFPINEFFQLYTNYANNTDVLQILNYFKTERFTNAMQLIFEIPKFRNIIDWIQNHNITIIESINRMAEFIKQFPRTLPPKYFVNYNNGVRHLQLDFLKLFPHEAFKKLFLNKLKSSIQFNALYEKLAALNFNEIQNYALGYPEINSVIEQLKIMGVDFDLIQRFVRKYLIWLQNIE